MPEMTGLEVAKSVKASHPQLPMILLTGWVEHGTGELAAGGAVDRILGKPVRLGDLLGVIAELGPASGGSSWIASSS
jgi:CheY-like chemotaxis protein